MHLYYRNLFVVSDALSLCGFNCFLRGIEMEEILSSYNSRVNTSAYLY